MTKTIWTNAAIASALTAAAALTTALERLKNVAATQGVWSFGPKNHTSNLASGMILVQFRDNRWVVAK